MKVRTLHSLIVAGMMMYSALPVAHGATNLVNAGALPVTSLPVKTAHSVSSRQQSQTLRVATALQLHQPPPSRVLPAGTAASEDPAVTEKKR